MSSLRSPSPANSIDVASSPSVDTILPPTTPILPSSGRSNRHPPPPSPSLFPPVNFIRPPASSPTPSSPPSLRSLIISRLADDSLPPLGANYYAHAYDTLANGELEVALDYAQYLEELQRNEAVAAAVAARRAEKNAKLHVTADRSYLDEFYEATPSKIRPKFLIANLNPFKTPRSGSTKSAISAISAISETLPADRESRGSLEYEEEEVQNDSESTFLQEETYGQLQRKLHQRHLQMIALSGTLGVGLYLSSLKNFSIAGPFGALMGFLISGLIVLATMLSLCEMITFIPLVGGVSGIGTRFVDDALGFATGFIYWVNYAVSLPLEITAGTIMLSYYDNIKLPGKGAVGWITFFLTWCIGVNLMDVRVYGELEFFLSMVKLAVILVLTILNIVINTGGLSENRIGFRYWRASDSDPAKGLTYGLFRPTFDLADTGSGLMSGIPGAAGHLLSLIVSTSLALYAYIGTEIVVIVAGEAKKPRKALPLATNRVFWRILVFYIVAIFCVSLNFYSGDPRLLRYRTVTPKDYDESRSRNILESIMESFGGYVCSSEENRNKLNGFQGLFNGNQLPWIIAFQNARLCSLLAVFNAIFVVFALSAGLSQLYASSRTLYQLSLQGKAPRIFSTCLRQGVPYYSVLFSGVFGSLAYLCINNDSNNVFQRLMTICATSGEIVWACMCLCFIRYYYGLRRRTDLVLRDLPSFPYRGPFQPFMAYFGLFGGMLTVLMTGVSCFLKGKWSYEFFFTSYGSLILFFLSYFGYKFVKGTKVLDLDQIQLDIGRKEGDAVVWEEKGVYRGNLRERLRRYLRYFV